MTLKDPRRRLCLLPNLPDAQLEIGRSACNQFSIFTEFGFHWNLETGTKDQVTIKGLCDIRMKCFGFRQWNDWSIINVDPSWLENDFGLKAYISSHVLTRSSDPFGWTSRDVIPWFLVHSDEAQGMSSATGFLLLKACLDDSNILESQIFTFLQESKTYSHGNLPITCSCRGDITGRLEKPYTSHAELISHTRRNDSFFLEWTRSFCFVSILNRTNRFSVPDIPNINATIPSSWAQY